MSDILKIITSDKKTIELPRWHLMKYSNVIWDLFKFANEEKELELEAIDFKTMTLIVKWVTHHKKYDKKDSPKYPDPFASPPSTAARAEKPLKVKLAELSEWDREFLNQDQQTIFEMINAANFLQMNPLLDMLCLHVSGMVHEKSSQEMRDLFGIKNDLDDETEDKMEETKEKYQL